MFTGLIEDIGKVASLTHKGSAAVLSIATSLPVQEIALGDSVAVNGVCLTVIAKDPALLTFDVSPESLDRTSFRTFVIGRKVNLERALRVGERLGGHLVTGHVDCTGTLYRSETRSGNHILTFKLPAANARYIIEKGSICIDGISLTVNTTAAESFSVNIIPHTFVKTTLATLKPDSEVNIETDIIGKYVERFVQPWNQRSKNDLSMKVLLENGFL